MKVLRFGPALGTTWRFLHGDIFRCRESGKQSQACGTEVTLTRAGKLAVAFPLTSVVVQCSQLNCLILLPALALRACLSRSAVFG